MATHWRMRGNAPCLIPDDGRVNVCYTGTLLPLGVETLRAVLLAARRVIEQHPQLHDRLRFYFFGTSNQSASTEYRVMAHARECGVEDIVHEHPARLDYLEALAALRQASALLLMGSSEAHYTASRFSPLLADRPTLAVYHEASTVVDIFSAAAPCRQVISYPRRRASSRPRRRSHCCGDDGNRRGSRTASSHVPRGVGALVGVHTRSPSCGGLRWSGRMTTPCRVTFVQTHPIQYMAPWFRYIAEHRPDVELTVLYGSTPTADQQGVGFGESFSWDVALLEGYRHSVLSAPAAGRRFDSESFTGVDVGGLDETIAATRPDVVVVPGWHSIYYMRAIAACRSAGIPVLYRGDSSLLSAPRGFKRYVWPVRTRMALSKFDGFLSVGTRIREYLRHFAIPAPLIFDSPHAVDNEYFANASRPMQNAERDTARRELGAGPDDFLVLFAGKFIERKRPADVILRRRSTRSRRGRRDGGQRGVDDRDTGGCRAGGRSRHLVRLSTSQACPGRSPRLIAAGAQRVESWGLIVNEALAPGRRVCVVSDGVCLRARSRARRCVGYVHAAR
jgi:hypothetical protein